MAVGLRGAAALGRDAGAFVERLPGCFPTIEASDCGWLAMFGYLVREFPGWPGAGQSSLAERLRPGRGS